MAERLYVIIPAAGSGSRMGTTENKLFMRLGKSGPSVIAKTLEAFAKLKDTGTDVKVVLVTSEDSRRALSEEVTSSGYDSFVEKIVLGGATRTESVYKGVQALKDLSVPPAPGDAVFIHDGARPLVDLQILEDGLRMLGTCEVCVAGVPLKNTVKQIASSDDGQTVVGTPDRSSLVEVQTPQCFRYEVLKKSYENAIANNIEATDDTALSELLGYKVRISRGSYRNIKITTPEDLIIAASFLNDSE